MTVRAQTRSVAEQLNAETRAMARYALATGLAVPPSVIARVPNAGSAPAAGEAVVGLADAHERLARIVAPATPGTLLLLEREASRGGPLRWLGPVRLARQMTVGVVLLIAAFIGLSLSPDVNSGSGSIFDSSGLPLLLNQLFFLSAAGIGAAFEGLFRANRYIGRGTYDPVYESSYWIRFILGIIAGLVLADLLAGLVQGSSSQLTRPMLALLGGFSASLVYRILNRLVETVESLVRGETREIVAARETAARARLAEQESQQRMRLSAGLIQLQEQIGSGADPEQISARVREMLDEVSPVLGLGRESGPRESGPVPVAEEGEASADGS